MKELSLNILDISENSVKAGASLTEILLDETEEELVLTIRDDGCGMSPETVLAVTDPFYTTRTTRKVGLGIPLLKLAAEQTGGSLLIESVEQKPAGADVSVQKPHGTTVTARFYKHHIDFTPLGDVVSSLVTLIQGHPQTDFFFEHRQSSGLVHLDTRELREVLGEEVSLSDYEVIRWIEAYLNEQYDDLLK